MGSLSRTHTLSLLFYEFILLGLFGFDKLGIHHWFFFFFQKLKSSSHNLTCSIFTCQFPISLLHSTPSHYGTPYYIIGPATYPWLQLHYWRGIAEAMSNLGCTVYIGRVPSTGDVPQRAEVLNSKLEKLIPGKQVNLIGHSMVRFLSSSIYL